MHHPPFATGIRHMDALGLAGADAMGAIVDHHPHVERVLCGHVHRAIQVRWHGTVASIAPSTAHQVDLDLRDGVPLTYSMEPPACQIHVWQPGTGLISHTSYTGRFAGPFRFREPAPAG
jgi:3',5'-cyclic AMP phosphodiesterase CpdA